MCKIIIIPNASKILEIEKFSRYCADILSGMPDGFGYAAQGKKGVFGARSLFPELYARVSNVPEYCVPVEHSFGEKSEIVGAAMFHGRMSTNVRDIANTHPISRDKWHLIHNGVVTDHGDKYKMLTSNDSEHVLKHLQTGGIDAVSANLTGYYAAGAFDDNGRLHVFRDSIAQLFYAYSKVLDSPVFATTQDLIHDIGDWFKESLTPIQVKDNTYLVFQQGKLVEQREFVSRGYDKYAASLAGKSLGYAIDAPYDFNAPELEAHLRPNDEYYTHQTSDDSPYADEYPLDDDDQIETSEIMAAWRARQRKFG